MYCILTASAVDAHNSAVHLDTTVFDLQYKTTLRPTPIQPTMIETVKPKHRLLIYATGSGKLARASTTPLHHKRGLSVAASVIDAA